MKKTSRIIEKFINAPNISSEALPGVALVEIAGNQRVLIEKHCGILSYGDSEIIVKAKYGAISVKGEQLRLAAMTKESLVITGCIQSVTLHRRGEE